MYLARWKKGKKKRAGDLRYRNRECWLCQNFTHCANFNLYEVASLHVSEKQFDIVKGFFSLSRPVARCRSIVFCTNNAESFRVRFHFCWCCISGVVGAWWFFLQIIEQATESGIGSLQTSHFAGDFPSHVLLNISTETNFSARARKKLLICRVSLSLSFFLCWLSSSCLEPVDYMKKPAWLPACLLNSSCKIIHRARDRWKEKTEIKRLFRRFSIKETTKTNFDYGDRLIRVHLRYDISL